MPCYCDIPDSSDQKQIEDRCKVKMYFDAQNFMTTDQVKESQDKNISMFPSEDVNSSLCTLCSILRKDQMEMISAQYFQIKWDHKTLYEWYLKHCIDDKKFNQVWSVKQ